MEVEEIVKINNVYFDFVYKQYPILLLMDIDEINITRTLHEPGYIDIRLTSDELVCNIQIVEFLDGVLDIIKFGHNFSINDLKKKFPDWKSRLIAQVL